MKYIKIFFVVMNISSFCNAGEQTVSVDMQPRRRSSSDGTKSYSFRTFSQSSGQSQKSTDSIEVPEQPKSCWSRICCCCRKPKQSPSSPKSTGVRSVFKPEQPPKTSSNNSPTSRKTSISIASSDKNNKSALPCDCNNCKKFNAEHPKLPDRGYFQNGTSTN